MTLQNARVAIQIDIGFGDVITPAATKTDYPVLLDFAAPKLLGYPPQYGCGREVRGYDQTRTVEQPDEGLLRPLAALPKLRLRWATLTTAIRRTFEHRHTYLVARPTALTLNFGSDAAKQAQWQDFHKRMKLDESPPSLQAVIDTLVPFLSPIASAVVSGAVFDQLWTATGPWRDRE